MTRYGNIAGMDASARRPMFSHRSVFIGQRGETNADAIHAMLYLGVPPFPQSPWHGVQCLAPDVDFSDKRQPDLEFALRRVIRRACPDRVATVSLSGGVDSTLIAALAKAEGIAVQAITVQFHDNDPDTENALRIARHLKLDVDVIRFDIDEALENLPQLRRCELPISDSSALSTYLVARRAAHVILDGTAADALYPSTDSLDRLLQVERLPWILRAPAAIPFRLNWKSELARKLKRLSRRTAAETQLANCYDGRFYERPDSRFVDDWFRLAAREAGPRNALIAQAVAFRSMGALAQKYTALQNKVCFPFAESADLTGRHLDKTEPKRVLKEMLCRYVPRELVYRRKYGFSMNQRAVFTTRCFVELFGQAARNLGLAEDLVDVLRNDDPVPWYVYNLVWSIVVIDTWI